MSRQRKKSKAVPVVLVITILVAALAVGCFLVKPMITDPLRKSSADNLVKQQNTTLRSWICRMNAKSSPAILPGRNTSPKAGT